MIDIVAAALCRHTSIETLRVLQMGELPNRVLSAIASSLENNDKLRVLDISDDSRLECGRSALAKFLQVPDEAQQTLEESKKDRTSLLENILRVAGKHPVLESIEVRYWLGHSALTVEKESLGTSWIGKQEVRVDVSTLESLCDSALQIGDVVRVMKLKDSSDLPYKPFVDRLVQAMTTCEKQIIESSFDVLEAKPLVTPGPSFSKVRLCILSSLQDDCSPRSKLHNRQRTLRSVIKISADRDGIVSALEALNRWKMVGHNQRRLHVNFGDLVIDRSVVDGLRAMTTDCSITFEGPSASIFSLTEPREETQKEEKTIMTIDGSSGAQPPRGTAPPTGVRLERRSRAAVSGSLPHGIGRGRRIHVAPSEERGRGPPPLGPPDGDVLDPRPQPTEAMAAESPRTIRGRLVHS